MRDWEAKGQLQYMAMDFVQQDTQGKGWCVGETTTSEKVGRLACPPLSLTCPGRDVISKLIPSWRIVPGICFESLALQVAEDYGVPGDVVARAYQLLWELQQSKGQQQRGAVMTSPHLPGATLPGEEGDRAADNDDDDYATAAAALEQEQEREACPSAAAGETEPAAKAKTLGDAVEVLRQVLAHLAEKGGGLQEEEEGGRGAAVLPSGVPEVHVLKPKQQPPSSHLQQSVVYVIR